jgi:low affinity Fe/Cu permease
MRLTVAGDAGNSYPADGIASTLAVKTDPELRMSFFDRAATHLARWVGHPGAFALACLIILVWGVMGPFLGYSDTWQLVINTSTTIVTFLMVFLIQNTQNRDSHALHLKIDELLRALDAADTRLVDLEERSEQELEKLREHYKALAANPAANGETCDPQQTASEGRAPEAPRNQSVRPRVQDPTS